jgi:hypothetical protein
VAEQHLNKSTGVGRLVTATSWVVAVALVLCVVIWHDQKFGGYWDETSRRGTLFLPQRGFRRPHEPSPEPVGSYPVWIAIMRCEANLSVGLAVASAGMVLVIVARQGPARRVWREPGTVACVVAVAALGLCALEETSRAIRYGTGPWGSPFDPFPNSWPLFEVRISLAVLGAWVVMAAMGRWKRSRTWVDRVGRAAGWLWLAVLLYRVSASLFIPFGNWRY